MAIVVKGGGRRSTQQRPGKEEPLVGMEEGGGENGGEEELSVVSWLQQRSWRRCPCSEVQCHKALWLWCVLGGPTFSKEEVEGSLGGISNDRVSDTRNLRRSWKKLSMEELRGDGGEWHLGGRRANPWGGGFLKTISVNIDNQQDHFSSSSTLVLLSLSPNQWKGKWFQRF